MSDSNDGQNIFSAIEKRDWVFYHPCDSFNTTVNLLKPASDDPDVLAIKTTMYRVGKKSPIIAALLHARKMGKAVTVLVVAPATLRREIIDRIDREINAHKQRGDGYIALKLNGLVDKGIIQALYRASMAGVRINLNVRGLCALRPGIKGVSENITVTSILGRFLEHSRVYYFRNGGADEVLIGSADMMPRNLNKRVEVLLIVPDPELKEVIIEYMLNIHLKDNVKARKLLSDGTYECVIPGPDDEHIDSQKWLIENRGIWHGDA